MRTLPAVLLALILLSSAAFATWQTTANILVQDENNRPVPHAKVTATWQLTERDIAHQESVFTDYKGIAVFNMTNYVQLERQTDQLVDVRADYGGGSLLVSQKKTFNVSGYQNPFALTLPLHRLRVNVFTPYGVPINGANVYIVPWTVETGPSGFADFLVPAKQVTYTAVLNDAQASNKTTIKGDWEANITLKVYKLTLKVVDQAGGAKSAVALFANKSYATDVDGVVRFNPFPGRLAAITVKSGGKLLTTSAIMNGDRELVVSFDSESPEIKEVGVVTLPDGKKTIAALIKDEGTYASGLSSVTLFWLVNGVERDPIEMYPQDASTYSVTLPDQPKGVEVTYYIRAVDKQGNPSISQVQSYGKTDPGISTNQTDENQTDGNQTGSGGFSFDLGGINWWLIIGVGAILIIAIVAYIYLKED